MTDESKGVVEVLPSKSGTGYFYHHKAANGEITVSSGSESFAHPTDAKEAAKRVFGEDVAFRVVYRKDAEGDGE